MDPSFATFLAERLDNRPPSEATHAWLSAQPDPVSAVMGQHLKTGLQAPSLAPGQTLGDYLANFHQSYALLDQMPAHVTQDKLSWTLSAIALMGDHARLQRCQSLYGKVTSEVERSFLWLARRGYTKAMRFLLPLTKTDHGKAPQRLLWELAQIGFETSNLSLYRSAVKSIRFTDRDLDRWYHTGNNFLLSLADYPDYCRLLLLGVAQRQPELLQPVMRRVFSRLKQLADWQLELLLELVRQRKLTLEKIYHYRLASPEQLSQVLRLVESSPDYSSFSAAELLDKQIFADAAFSILETLFNYSLAREDAAARDALLDALLISALAYSTPQAAQLILSIYPGLTPNSCLQSVIMGEEFLGPALPYYVDLSRQLFEQHLPLLRELVINVQTGTAPLMVQTLLLIQMTPQDAFSISSYLHSMLSTEPLPYEDWRQYTGLKMLETLQGYSAHQRALILIGLGYDDPVPAQIETEEALALATFCGCYQTLEVVAKVLTAVEELDDIIRSDTLHQACLFGRLEIAEWLLDSDPITGHSFEEWIEALGSIPGRQEIAHMLTDYQTRFE